MSRRTLPAIAALLASTVVVGAATTADSSPSRLLGPRLSRVAVAVALGDSVASGTHCACTPFPELSASRLHGITGRRITMYNDAVSGYRSRDVLAQLWADPSVIAHVRVANVVEILVGANDIGYSAACRTSAACYRPALVRAHKYIVRIVSRIRALTDQRPVAIVLMGYWNAWLDGRYAAERGSDYVTASRALTLQQNATIRAAAVASGSIYVDLWRVFRGAADADDTELLASDGDHPNAVGHTRIAAAITSALAQQLAA